MRDDPVGWYDVTRAEPFPTSQWDVQRMLSKSWHTTSRGPQDDGEQRQRETTDNDWQWPRDYYEITGRNDEHKYAGWYDPFHYDEAPGSHAPTDKGLLNSADYKMVSDRTNHFTEDLVNQMDGRNLQRMECLKPWVQRDVIHTYAPREGKQIRDINKYLGAVIGEFQRMAQSGLEETESERRIALSKSGRRLKYHTCWQYGHSVTCTHDRDCHNVHIRGVFT